MTSNTRHIGQTFFANDAHVRVALSCGGYMGDSLLAAEDRHQSFLTKAELKRIAQDSRQNTSTQKTWIATSRSAIEMSIIKFGSALQGGAGAVMKPVGDA